MAGALGERAVGEGTVRTRDTRSACAQAAKEPARFFLCFSLRTCMFCFVEVRCSASPRSKP